MDRLMTASSELPQGTNITLTKFIQLLRAHICIGPNFRYTLLFSGFTRNF